MAATNTIHRREHIFCELASQISSKCGTNGNNSINVRATYWKQPTTSNPPIPNPCDKPMHTNFTPHQHMQDVKCKTSPNENTLQTENTCHCALQTRQSHLPWCCTMHGAIQHHKHQCAQPIKTTNHHCAKIPTTHIPRTYDSNKNTTWHSLNLLPIVFNNALKIK